MGRSGVPALASGERLRLTMRLLALTDLRVGAGSLLAEFWRRAGVDVVVAGPGESGKGELTFVPCARVAPLLQRVGDVDAVAIFECGGQMICPPDLVQVPVPTLFYGVDTHLRFGHHLRIGRLCDAVFLAQKEYTLRFQRLGVKQAEWLPLAANPDAHRPVPGDTTHDIVFVGNVNPRLHVRRAALIGRLQRHFRVLVATAPYHEVAGLVARGRIAFNCSMAGELNLRVFEMLACRRCLLTDRAPGSGLKDLFRGGKHLALYDEGNLEAVAQDLLARLATIERLAEAGHAETMARHLWTHRVSRMRDVLAGTQSRRRADGSANRRAVLLLQAQRCRDFAEGWLRRPGSKRGSGRIARPETKE